MLLLPEGQTVEACEPPKKQSFFENWGALVAKVDLSVNNHIY
jgi:hypothetical protein